MTGAIRGVTSGPSRNGGADLQTKDPVMSTQTLSPAFATQTSAPMTAPDGAVRWTIDPAHSIAHFSVRHMMVSNVRGQFSGVGGTVLIAPDLKQLQVQATIDATTVDTRE